MNDVTVREMNTKDVSDKSITLLEEAVKQFLGVRPWVTDWRKEYDPHCENSDFALTMGSYFETIFQTKLWPQNDFQLFCLSPAVKNLLVNVFYFDEQSVGCFSRYDLFPKTNVKSEIFELSPETNLYFAGRLSPQKNIEFLILTFFYLQILFSSKLTLHLLGDFDNEYHKDIAGCPFGEYKNKIVTLIESLPWPGEAPIFVHGKNETEWLNFIPENGLFFSCSNLISEDFSVTAAQLEEKGRAMLLPYWGGFMDITADNVSFYSAEYIAHSHLDLKTTNSAAKKLAGELIKGNYHKNQTALFKTYFPEQKINRAYLKQKIEENKKRWGSEIDLLVSDQRANFVTTEAGQRLFKECRQFFGRDYQNKI